MKVLKYHIPIATTALLVESTGAILKNKKITLKQKQNKEN